MNIHIEQSGCIKYKWVALDGRASVRVGYSDISDEEAISRAKSYWAMRDKEDAAAEYLRKKHNRAVFIGFLPTDDINCDIPATYVYVLKDRKKHGKFQILEAIKVQ